MKVLKTGGEIIFPKKCLKLAIIPKYLSVKINTETIAQHSNIDANLANRWIDGQQLDTLEEYI